MRPACSKRDPRRRRNAFMIDLAPLVQVHHEADAVGTTINNIVLSGNLYSSLVLLA